MTPAQQSALEALAGRSFSQVEVSAISALVEAGNMGAIADVLSIGRPPKIVSRRVSQLGIRSLDVLPRHRHALLTVLKDAATARPVWLDAALEAAGVPAEDRDALADDLSCADYWLKQPDGLDAGATGTRQMLDVIALVVTAAAPACVAAKKLAEVGDPIHYTQVSAALEGAI